MTTTTDAPIDARCLAGDCASTPEDLIACRWVSLAALLVCVLDPYISGRLDPMARQQAHTAILKAVSLATGEDTATTAVHS